MTYHISKDYHCLKCQALYIPFNKDISCPKCGFQDSNTEEYYSFVRDVLQSMIAHKMRYGRYRPNAWYTGHISEALQSECFKLFDAMEYNKPKNPIEYINSSVVEIEDEGTRNYINSLFTAVYELYRTEKRPRLIKSGRVRLFLRRLFLDI